MMPKKIVILFIYILGYISTASLKISNKMAICPESHSQCFFCCEKVYTHICEAGLDWKFVFRGRPAS